jgi:hypothetical protein
MLEPENQTLAFQRRAGPQTLSIRSMRPTSRGMQFCVKLARAMFENPVYSIPRVHYSIAIQSTSSIF